ncbi:hypothetical protein MYU51_018079 [Penicillium brevicompactum]|uniref:uncharacterized protein n=1 Tax=Penicillium brevicompactum TaxID=5074 RepID=UPI00253F8049|nr:uncharacterized protein N7506_010541 [Penicillium brevicompactum]KAJ5327439.1 hypothetical protein N7506_010541 [Penicillium brevicompactum]
MPPLAGEERLVTLFADIHYYFTEPTRRPLPYHHRFDKGSYLYIYHNAAQNKARIEIANNPGSPEQDAFCGHLDKVHIRHSSQFPTLCTLTVEDSTSPQQQHYPSDVSTQHEWRLPSGDPRAESKDFRDFPRLHTLDIYFWGVEDSTQFLDAAVLLLSSSQVETDREPAPQQEQPMSSVVQQLENVAVSDPAYQNGQTPNSRSGQTAEAPTFQPPPQISSFPPPPPSGPPAEQQSSTGPSPVEEKKDPASFAPLPYNPAAPAAPEPIQHREKTPPPEDGMTGTGLAAAVAADNGIPYTPPNQTIGGAGVGVYASPPPSNQGPGLQYAGPPAYTSPPPSAGLQHSNSFSAVQPSTQSPAMAAPSYPQSFISGQGHPNSRQGSMSFAPPPQDPNAHLFDRQVYGGAQSQTPPQHQATPLGGYSNYSYNRTSAQNAQPQPQQLQRAGSEYDIHSQVYRPTEIEAGHHNQKYAQKAMKNPGQRPRKLEEKAERLEGGMNRFLKKLERKL